MAVKLEETPHGAFALAFAEAVAKGHYDLAYSMLSATLQASTSARQIAENYEAVIGPYDCPPDNFPDFEVMNVSDEQTSRLEISTGKTYISTGGAYVAMSNNYYCEAVSVVIAEEQGEKVIREIYRGGDLDIGRCCFLLAGSGRRLRFTRLQSLRPLEG